MSRDILANIIEDFNPDKFTRFFREKNRTFAPRKEELSQYNDESFKNGLKLGEINFAASEQMIICVFSAAQALSERSGKKAQYEKGKRILREQQADSGIFIFCDKKGDFRFSLIYANYLGKRRDWSTFRRFTYFVSREFTNKTFLQRIGDGEFSTVENIKEAFSVEPVNKEFYARISMLFTKLAGGERRIGKDEFKGKGLLHLPSTTDDTLNKEFTIRLIGRLVFCWFLKKKHSESGLPLLSNELLSMGALMKNENYYHSILEPLFFETLNTPAEERKKKFQLEPWAHVPFLNGGLFSPDEHDFYEVNELGISEFINVLKVPDKWIKDILEVFETYNFTIDENTSVDVELAIDPEILGRIFENLLAEINPETGETARKSTGSYYTPRPIVEYMVDESLKQYLLTKVKISEDKASSLLSYSNEEINLSESEKDSVLDALDVIKIIDPACGSGAFPMGILHKMLLILQKIDPDSQKWIEKKLSKIESATVRKELGKKLREENWNYVHKLGIIQSSIYGIDIQPVATEISRLRFFLSLVVDERVEDDKPNRGIDPLPNLEFKFICANSLIPLEKEGNELFDNNEMAQQMQDIRDRYFKTDNARIKDKMKKDFENILRKGCSLFASQKQKQLLTYHPFDTNNVCSFFDSKFMFGVDEFDIAIANPPYIKEYVNRDAFDGLRSSPYYQGKMDIWYFFACKGLDLLKTKSGMLTFIAQNNWVTSFGASKMRIKVIEDTRILKLIDFGNFKIFENSGIQTMIMIFESDRINDNYQFDFRRLTGEGANFTDILDLLTCNKNAKTEYLKPIIQRSDFINKNLTFSNSTFEGILSKIHNQRNFQLDEKNEVAQGIVCPQDYVNKASQKILGNDHKVNDGIFILNDEEKRALAFTDKELELIKPLYTTNELFKYYGNSKNREWIIYTDSRFNNAKNIQPYSNIKNHLDKFIKVITSDNKPYGLHRARDEYFFRGEKIISVRKCTEPIFTYTNFDCYVTATFYVIKSERINLKYLTALLNSKLIAFWLKHKGKMQGNNYQVDKEPILDIPTQEGSVAEQKSLAEVVDKIINVMQGNDYMQNSAKQTKVKEYERQIDQMVYKLYGLTEEEIKIVEGLNSEH